MKADDAYIEAFQTVVQDTENTTGLTLPWHIKQYVVHLLAERVKHDLQPRHTYAETVLAMTTARDAKSLGDSALWLTGVFPSVPQRNYKTEIGRIAYSRLTHESLWNTQLFVDLEEHMYPVRNFITQVIRPVHDPFHE